MMSRRRLRARAAAPSEDAFDAAELGSVVLRPLGHRPLILPRSTPAWWDQQVERLALFGEAASAVLAGLFKTPARCYELTSESDSRRVALVYPLSTEHAYLVTAVLTVDLSSQKQVVDWGSLVVETVALDAPEARETLVRLSEQVTDESLRARDPDGVPASALIVGDVDSTTRTVLARSCGHLG